MLNLWIMVGAGVVLASAWIGWWKWREPLFATTTNLARLREALARGQDVVLVYWSSQQRRFVRKAVTPEGLQEGLLEALDHDLSYSRWFRVARIKKVTVVTGLAPAPRKLGMFQARPLLWGRLALVFLAVFSVGLWLRQEQPPTELVSDDSPAPPVPAASPRTRRVVAGPSSGARPAEPGARATAAPADAGLAGPETSVTRALTLFQQHDFNGAILECTRAIKLNPRLATAYWLRAYAELARGEFPAAVADGDRALALDPGLFHGYCVRGTARQYVGAFAGALADFEAAARLDPQSPIPHNARAWARYRQGDFAGAIVDANQALTLAARDADAFDTRAWAKYVSGDVAGATEDCRQAVAHGGDNQAAMSAQGLLHFIKGDFGGAVTNWRRAVTVAPFMNSDLAPWIAKAEAAGK